MLKSVSFCLTLMTSVTALAAPTVTIEGSPGVDGSGIIQAAGVVQLMFNGKTPPHGFQLCASPQPTDTLFFSDVGPMVANDGLVLNDPAS